jgi:hypothetical protein
MQDYISFVDHPAADCLSTSQCCNRIYRLCDNNPRGINERGDFLCCCSVGGLKSTSKRTELCINDNLYNLVHALNNKVSGWIY